MNTNRDGDDIALSGPPRNVRGMIPVHIERAIVVPITLNIGERSTLVRAVLHPVADKLSEVRVRLPEQLLPGRYHGEATFNDTPHPVVITILSAPRIRVQPEQTVLVAEAASSESFVLWVINTGNVDIDIPKEAAFDVDDVDGQDRALGRSMRATLKPGEPRVERFFEELRESHGGEARVSVRGGAGPLVPGEAREISCVLAVPQDARAGRTYSGSFEIGPVSHVVVADITISARPNKERVVQ